MIEQSSRTIAGLVLAGGEGRRLRGADKGMVAWQGRPMAAWVTEALAPAVATVIISANRSLDDYRTIAPEVVTDDERYRWQGPLAGLMAGLHRARALGYRALAVSPCDTPDLETAVVSRLYHAWETGPARAVFAAAGGRSHPLHGVYPVSVLPELGQWLSRGERRVQGFLHQIQAQAVDCDQWRGSFINRNRPEELGQ